MITFSRSATTITEVRTPKPLNRIAPALEALAKDYGDRWTVGKLADICCMSESNFRRVWKDAIGQTLQEYIISMRCRWQQRCLDHRAGLFSMLA
ncbi:AraC family transcriptional regulator [Pararhizobium sp. PWRC1-1]|uniref:AraC family transcriptional regulator n=1 Tax=Pararhizobium sp. PWRC1-1 TaxID=2804566 RepID=UPI003CF0FEB2